MIKQFNATVYVECDACDRQIVVVDGVITHGLLLNEGWAVMYVGSSIKHYCDDCVECII